MKRAVGALLALLGSWSASAWAGEVFGVITEAGKPLAKAQVELVQGGDIHVTTTDARGSYRLVLPKSGKAKLTVKTDTASPSIDIFSSERPLRYDLTLAGGKLKRR
jgi:hypothetical protein